MNENIFRLVCGIGLVAILALIALIASRGPSLLIAAIGLAIGYTMAGIIATRSYERELEAI